MSDLMIEVEGLTKDYGYTRAVDKVSFSVRRGEVLGFLGPNGAGKSTTMKILTCFLAPTAGRAVVAGHDVFDDSLEVRKRVGYLPEDTPIYRDMTVVEFLQFAAEMRGMDRDKAAGRIKEIGTRCGLGDVAGKLVGELSKGFRQRVGLAQAMLHDPDIVILDEPTSGLDPNQIVEIRSLIKEIGQREDGHPVDAHPPRGAGDLQPHRHHQRRQAGRRRHAGRAARARARRPLPRGRRVERRPQGRHPRPAGQPGRGRALRGDRGRGRARTRSRSTRAAAATCASRSSARRSTTAGRCWSWRASPPAWKTFSVTSRPEKKSSHEPALVISRREIRAYFNSPVAYIVVTRVHDHHRRILFFTQFFLSEAGRACAASSRACRCCSCSWRPAITMRLLAEEKSIGHAGAADHDAGPRLAGRAGEVPGGDGAARARRCCSTLVFAITVRALGRSTAGRRSAATWACC